MAVKRANRHQPLSPPPGGAAIRMYRQGLGDCFLLAFATGPETRPAYMLIDCGVHLAQTGGAANVKLVFDDIVATTEGRLDVVVATHEHTDHVYGFVAHAESLLNGRLQIDQLWLGWTEDPKDPVAQSLAASKQAAHQALIGAYERLRKQTQERPQFALGVRIKNALSGFGIASIDDEDVDVQLAHQLGFNNLAHGGSRISISTLALLLLQKAAKSVSYLRPGGQSLSIGAANAARAYVLGPPTALASLRKSTPSSGTAQETYLTTSLGLASLNAALGNGKDEPGEHFVAEPCYPFGREFRVPLGDAEFEPFFRQHYSSAADDWRRIDDDWLFAAEQLALHLDRHTNNTSLALALELGEPGKGQVLLFPADAQVGSWLSWSELGWGNAKQPMKIPDLLSRVVFYKVGHHASHNATLKRDVNGAPYGLELMPDNLIAFIPVDHEVASKLPGWHMPDPRLYAALQRKAPGRLLRSDSAADSARPPAKLTPVAGLPGAKWRHSRSLKSSDATPLFYDLQLTSIHR